MFAQIIETPLTTQQPGGSMEQWNPNTVNLLPEPESSGLLDQQKLYYQAAKCTAELLWTLGIPMHVHGYHYLLEAAPLVLSSPEMGTNLSHQLYPCIAKHYRTSASCVERSIRNAINLAWKRGSLAAANGLFGRSLNLAYDKPTNSEMIAMLTEKVRLQLYEANVYGRA